MFRICLYGAPGSGKSTLHAYLFYRLKKDGYNVEQVLEEAKEYVYLGLKPDHYIGLNWMTNQMRKETLYLKNKVDVVVTDSPVFLSALYSKFYGSPSSDEMLSISAKYDQLFSGLHIFLPNHKWEYIKQGRYQEKDEADKLNGFFLEELTKYVIANKFLGIYGDMSEDSIYRHTKCVMQSYLTLQKDIDTTKTININASGASLEDTI